MSSLSLAIVQKDPWLESVTSVLEARHEQYLDARADIKKNSRSLRELASLHQYAGLQFVIAHQKWTLREWAPQAKAISLRGDFNDWNAESHPLHKLDNDFWEIELPAAALQHGQRYKIHVHGADGTWLDRIPALATRVVQDEETKDFAAQVWQPEEAYQWQHDFTYAAGSAPRIYEAHVGMAGEEGRVHSYREFADKVIPRIKNLGYNVIQFMAIAEHPYYGSFGYHVSSFYAPSSRFGTPEDLKYLVDTAHAAGLAVLMDIVHSHAVKNMAEGLTRLDGSDHQYFHPGEKGDHPQWDSKCFDYGRPEVRHFLLSNLRYWIEEFHFDGFRFDGITSMLYWHRGTAAFGDHDSYFGPSVDDDAILYLKLATTLINKLKKNPLIIAEDMSGMPGLCQPVADGGIGFTHRLAMGIPDFWIKLLKHQRDEDWNLDEIWNVLTNRNRLEKNIAYAESHDQALVGDKTIAFRLMDQEMYWHMSRHEEFHPVIERGLALHKLIRMLTFVLGGEGWLGFMGNEFGHPEWVDFPREGNAWSYHHCRRQWSLVDNPDLRYHDFNAFDKALQELDRDNGVLNTQPANKSYVHNDLKILVVERNNLIFAFNLHPTESYPDLEIPINQNGTYRIILDSDRAEFGGHQRLADNSQHISKNNRTKIYLPSRSALVLKKVK